MGEAAERPFYDDYPIPDDRSSVAGWDHFWDVRIPVAYEIYQSYDFTDRLIPALMERGCRRVLFAGNGISLEPRVYAAAGFEVAALDISPRATAYAEQFEVEPKHLRRFAYFAKQQPTAEQCNAAVTYVAGSLLDRDICPGPYDAVISRRTLQLFDQRQMVLGIAALYQRVAKGGVLVNHSHNGYSSSWFIQKVLQSKKIPVSETHDIFWLLQECPDRHVVWLPNSSG